MAKVLIIGGGIIGLCTAVRLLQAGQQVIIIDRECGKNGASYGNAGHIATEQTEPLASWAAIKSFPKRWFMSGGALSLPPVTINEWLPFSLRLIKSSLPKNYAKGQAAIKSLTTDAMVQWHLLLNDISCGELIADNGHYIVWESEQSASDGVAAWKAKDLGNAGFSSMTPGELNSIEELTNIKLYGGIKFKGTGHIKSTERLLSSLINYLKKNGAEFISNNVLEISRDYVVLDNRIKIKGDIMFVSAGVWSKMLLEPLGYKVPIIAERGYHLQTDWGHGTGKWGYGLPPVVFEDRSMIITSFEKGLRIASFVELSHPKAKADRRKWKRLRENAELLGIEYKDDCDEWLGCRPTLPDYIPAIGQTYNYNNIYYAFGHQHLGLTLAAITAKIVKEMICEEKMPSKAFDLLRFK